MFENLNHQAGQVIANYPIRLIAISLVSAAVLSLGLINLDLEHDIRASFSPRNSRASYENRIYKEFYNLTAPAQRAFILFSAKDNASILRENQLHDVNKLDAYFSSFLSKIDPETGVRGCDPLCNLNKPFKIISRELLKMYKNENNTPSEDLILDYPMSVYKGQNMFIGMNMIGAKTIDRVFPSNNSRIISVKTIILWYFSRADAQTTKEVLREISLKLFKESQTDKYLEHATTLMTVGFALMVVFVFISMYTKLRRMRTCTVPVVVFVSVICPFIASIAAFGILTWLGNKTYTIMCVTPFLVLGVGVDDAFIMVESWMKNNDITNRKNRLSAVLVNIGPSITITSLTNTVAFGIGYATPTPQMSLFCFCTSVALFLDYLVTYSILAPIIYLVTPPTEAELMENKVALQIKDTPLIAPPQPFQRKKPPYFIEAYAKFICSNRGRFTALCTMVILYLISYIGVTTMKSTFEPSKAFPSDSPLANSMDSIRSVFNEFFPINIIVNRPPNITDPAERKYFYQMVEELEALPESYGKDRTLLWLRTYEEMDRKASDLFSSLGFSVNHSPTYDNLDFFLEKVGYPPTIKYSEHNGIKKVDAFQFTIIVRDMAEWSNRAIMEEKCRVLLEKYPLFNATLYDGDAAVLNLLLTVKVDLIGSIAVTVICMTVICSFFICNQVGVVIIAFVITSICFSLVGLISWWGADIDPVTMVDVLLATGFSVDYTAHIAHQYYVKTGTPEERIAKSLHDMFTPMLQAGISTILCMLPLIFVPTYAIFAFAKTIFVVVGLGLLHGLFYIPIFLTSTTSLPKAGLLLTS